MEPKKKGRPKTENPLQFDVKVRVDAKSLKKLDYCKEKLKTTRAEVLRQGLNKIYDDLKDK